ncbi:MAG: PAS domain S-box protein [Desulfobacterales bacterium]|nr:PAS domain S-box protein [Desulfobacterales bacterium]
MLELDLIKSEKKYRTILESIEQGYYELDLRGNFVFYNEIMAELFGCNREELRGKNYKEFMDNDNASNMYKLFKEIYKTGKPNKGFICDFIRKDGLIRQLGASASLMYDDNNKCIGFRGIARDISERKFMESQLAHVQKMESIGQLAAGIAHEINTPIQYIGDNTYFLQDAFKDISRLLVEYEKLLKFLKSKEDIDALINEIENIKEEIDIEYLIGEVPLSIKQSLDGLTRTANIVRAMKEFSHPGTGENTSVDINRAIDSTALVARNEWKYVAEMEMELDSTLPFVKCVQGEFNQVILNLIINAAHAIGDVVGDGAKKKGKITIRTKKINGTVEVQIQDTGIGIAPEIRPKIFTPFFTTKAVGKGTGQGLSLCHAIVNKLGGAIHFETEVGVGTTFFIRFKAEEDPLNKG